MIALATIGSVRANRLLTQEWDYVPETVQIPSDAESIARGEYFTTHFMLCTDCHGADLGGEALFNPDEGLGTLWAPIV